MDKNEMKYFKEKLLKEKNRVKHLIEQIKEFEAIDSESELSSELSLYDNHPADTGQQFYDKSKGAALQKNEIEILNSIDDSLKDIENGTYGTCRACGKKISKERLNFMPYVKYCIECKKAQHELMPPESHNRPPEEEVIQQSFGREVDREDSYKQVENFNKMKNVYDYVDYEDGNYDDGNYDDEQNMGFVEKVEKISNQQYKNQLPD